MSHPFFMKRFLPVLMFVVLFSSGLLAPSVSHAASLNADQVNSILGILRAFGADEPTVSRVALALGSTLTIPNASASDPAAQPAPAPLAPPYVPPPVVDSPYTSSGIGYDISFNTHYYPATAFGFAVIGATAGKAYTHNARLATEFSWARLSSTNLPTMYLNLNAPYGSSATTARLSAPRACNGKLFGATTTSSSAGGTFPEPTACAAYNYGYNAAKDAYAYASSQPYVAASLWWLDIEDANSWSENTAINDQVIQGAIDYLNSVNIQVGLYSMPYMWRNIAGDGFTPTESLGNRTQPVPTWFPIGIDTQVGAINACRTRPSFIAGSPVWLIQYELDSTAVDQNIAC